MQALPGFYSLFVQDAKWLYVWRDSIVISFISSTHDAGKLTLVAVATNPFTNQIEVSQLDGEGSIQVFDVSGRQISAAKYDSENKRSLIQGLAIRVVFAQNKVSKWRNEDFSADQIIQRSQREGI